MIFENSPSFFECSPKVFGVFARLFHAVRHKIE